MFDTEQITKLLKSFYTVTGVKVVIFDPYFNEILAYPDKSCELCRFAKKNYPERCRKSEKEFCNKSKSMMNLYTGRCHAGFVEAVFPITKNSVITGYIMFGQLRMPGDVPPKGELGALFNKAVCKTNEEIDACTDILRTLGQYIMSRQPKLKPKTVTGVTIAEYITQNLSSDLSVDAICKKFLLSRSKLYNLTSPYMPKGIAGYVKTMRLNKAKELLQKGELSVPVVASEVGYGDYNYFCKDFKRNFGISAKEYRIGCNIK